MERVFVRLLSLALMICTFVSCGIVDMIEAEQPVSINTSNVYKDLDMDVFKGFVDKMTVGELIRAHGRPGSILDANEEAMVEGYDIYQYQYPDCTIDCYVPRKVDGKLIGGILEDTLKMNELVDYIYYEPNKNIKLKSFVLNDSISQLIPQGKSVVYYIGDSFNNIVRFRLAKDNKGEILNVALNDISIFEEEKKLSAIVSEWNSKLPISLGDLGYLDAINLNKKELCFNIAINDSLLNFDKLTSENPLWEQIIGDRLFEKGRGLFNWLTSVVISEGAGVKFMLFNKNNHESISKNIDYSSFKRRYELAFSNIRRLESFIRYENLPYPCKLFDEIVCEKIEIKDGYLVLPFTIDGEAQDELYDNMDNLKQHDIDLLRDTANPDRNYLFLCYKCKFGLKKQYYYTFTEETVEVVFSPEEVKQLIKQM